jgi:hypothetical protein
MFRRGGWRDFATHYECFIDHVVKLLYRGQGCLSVKIFDDTLFRRSYYPLFFNDFGPDIP